MAGSKARILVVEDDAPIRALLGDRLTQYDLVFATCQSECYAQLESPDFDLVLLDLRLPRAPGEMAPTDDVGIDILDQIRKQRVLKRGSTIQIPIVVMTAHGMDPVPVLTDHGANDYIKKPFGQGQTLEERIARALEGRGALVPAGNLASSRIEIAFHPTDEIVRVERFEYGRTHYELLCLLRDLHVDDRNDGRGLKAYRGYTGDELADKLGISNKAVRQRIADFRKDVNHDFRSSLGRTLDKDDIIENRRKRDGYRLNPSIIHIGPWNA